MCETKHPGVALPQGQHILLNGLYRLGCFTICIIWGKVSPEKAKICEALNYGGKQYWAYNNVERELYQAALRWYELADK